MLCEKCKQNKATSHYTRTVNGERKDYYLCSECASQLARKYSDGMGLTGLLGSYTLGIDSILNSMLENGFGGLVKNSVKEERCPLCGSTFKEIKSSGMAGCAKCYEVFSEDFEPIVERFHGKSAHSGKVPASAEPQLKTKKEIERLQKDMEKAIAEENFEKAADLRDALRKLRGDE